MGAREKAMKGATPTMPSARDLKTQVSRQIAPRASARSPRTLVSGESSRRPWFSKLAVPFFAFSLSLFVVAVGLLVKSRFSAPVTTSPETPTAPSNTAGEASSATALFFRVTPADASLYLDGEALPDNPARVSRPRDGKSHKARAVANGYAPKEVTVSFDGTSVQVDIALEPLPSSATSITSAAVERPARKQASASPAALPPAPSASSGRHPAKVIIDPTDPWQR
jgi:hypothetical protein